MSFLVGIYRWVRMQQVRKERERRAFSRRFRKNMQAISEATARGGVNPIGWVPAGDRCKA